MAITLPGITPAFIVAMQAEKDELDARLGALSKVVQTKDFERVSESMQYLMTAQLFAMQTYSAILGTRLAVAATPVKLDS